MKKTFFCRKVKEKHREFYFYFIFCKLFYSILRCLYSYNDDDVYQTIFFIICVCLSYKLFS